MLRSSLLRPLRRCLHTQAPNSTRFATRSRLGLALGASAVAGTYFAWRLTADSQRISLDSPPRQKKTKPASSPVVAEPVTSAASEHAEHSEELLPPVDETPTPPESTSSSPDAETSDPSADGESTSEGEVPDASSESPEDPEGGQGGAFNPVTGEINWDCPCLGGMAHGPCGPQFREAFSCFVFSEQEPKGIDCVEKFKAMQDCFREHPDVYGEDIMNDDDDEDGEVGPSSQESESAAVEQSLTDSPPLDTSGESASSLTPPASRTSASGQASKVSKPGHTTPSKVE
ncbi:hypothetical protein JAAARDRAFT_209908 [Jaapia argillacea MUCL 33604]|uniref:Mitochondrial intermembrane space import and assembly protein 40 n=1 Tax=Jaapia argillacea MUCL 33604 TaxID=933084 RepID=A0A067PQG7_9AGAM|nr:hypothetical protein JAAARDRAFT_209908 [Jaapia argillacea MUCL 33604]